MNPNIEVNYYSFTIHNWEDVCIREKKYLLGQLFDKNLYDIDHIIPRKLKKDDSIINNLVLVKKTINQHDKKR